MIERILGIDFSGAASAGKSIWISEAHLDGRRVHIEGCRSAAELPGSGPSRTQCLPVLVEHVGAQRCAVVGCDFPFSLPAIMIDAADWRTFALGFGERFERADDFLGDCRRRAFGRELKRACDSESRVPFSAYNLRIYRQTFHGIRDFLAPLLRGSRAVVLPMEQPDGPRPWIVETCPASTLKHADLYPSYKGPGAAARDARATIINGLVGRRLIAPLSSAIRRLALDNTGGDALDSIIAAAATGRAYLTGQFSPRGCAGQERIEGRVYF